MNIIGGALFFSSKSVVEQNINSLNVEKAIFIQDNYCCKKSWYDVAKLRNELEKRNVPIIKIRPIM